MRSERILLAMLVLAMLLAGCADEGPGPGAPGEVPEPPLEHSVPDPREPLGPLATLVKDAASTDLPFVPLRLDLPGSEWVYVPGGDPPSGSDLAAASAAFTYSTSKWGDVVVLEYLDSHNQRELLEEASALTDEGCVAGPPDEPDAVSCTFDPFQEVPLTKDIHALIGVQDPVISVTWIQEPVRSTRALGSIDGLSLRVEIYGDSAVLASDEAAALAAALAGGDHP
jgi:hypothetical protein